MLPSSCRQGLHLKPLENRCLLAAVSSGEAAILQMELDVVDVDGAPLSQVAVGSDFRLQLVVQDLRPTADFRGAFSAFADIVYRADTVQLDRAHDTEWMRAGPNYPNASYVDASVDGILNEAGGVAASLTGLGTDKYLVASFTFTAKAPGTARFGIDAADERLQHPMLAYGLNEVVDQTVYVPAKLQVTTVSGDIVPDDDWRPSVDQTFAASHSRGNSSKTHTAEPLTTTEVDEANRNTVYKWDEADLRRPFLNRQFKVHHAPFTLMRPTVIRGDNAASAVFALRDLRTDQVMEQLPERHSHAAIDAVFSVSTNRSQLRAEDPRLLAPIR